ncbi:MAG TPA: N-acetyl-gamma-glutamyl-phosphate reductase [Thermoanaerobaculia bacterium]|nr:N-acetyl-gamma-glutamyl-phosphate reductase [Thermoanaerobaculia bacterium]
MSGAAPSGLALQEVGVAPETAAHAAAAAAPGTALGVEPDAAAARSSAPGPVPVLVVGGSGYVAGEALRLLAGHPRLLVAGVVSESQAGQPVAAAFPHLASAYPDVRFHAVEELPRLIDLAAEVAAEGAALCAAPHGAAAKLVDLLLASAERAGARLRVVDLSADFRFAAAADYENVYGHAHGAPDRLAGFRCALPEHADLAFGTAAATAADAPPPLAAPWHIAHPGCFPTAVLLAAVPLLRLGWIEPSLQVVAVTGSTGAGRTPSPTTHHPARRSNLFAYSPLAHRHEPEMRGLAAAAVGAPVAIHFVPQAGPFARGIYATVQARLLRPARAGHDEEQAAAVRADLERFYAAAPFVDVLAEPPRLQDVVGSNRCRLGVAVAGDRLVAFSAIDNLTKGAAGGGIQWLNRLLGFPETAGLTQPGIGWL